MILCSFMIFSYFHTHFNVDILCWVLSSFLCYLVYYQAHISHYRVFVCLDLFAVVFVFVTDEAFAFCVESTFEISKAIEKCLKSFDLLYNSVIQICSLIAGRCTLLFLVYFLLSVFISYSCFFNGFC